MDEGGAVGYRNSADAEDKSPLVAKPGQRVRAVRASERWVLAQNGLWLPRQFLGGVGGEDGLELPLRATYRRVMAHNEVSLPTTDTPPPPPAGPPPPPQSLITPLVHGLALAWSLSEVVCAGRDACERVGAIARAGLVRERRRQRATPHQELRPALQVRRTQPPLSPTPCRL